MLFFHILGIIIPIDFNNYFAEGLKPPTSTEPNWSCLLEVVSCAAFSVGTCASTRESESIWIFLTCIYTI